MNLARAEEKLSQDLSQSNLVHSDEDFCSMVEEYHSVTKQMSDSAKVCTDLLQLTIYNPLKKYGAEFASAQAAIKKRDQLITDLLPFRGKLEKLRERERTGSNIARTEQLKRQLSTLESDFKVIIHFLHPYLLARPQSLIGPLMSLAEPSTVGNVLIHATEKKILNTF